MRYCLLQTSLDPLPMKRLERAFLASGTRLALDVPAVARYAFGILLDDLSATAASRLAFALDQEGIAVEPWPQEDLPPLPRARLVRRLEIDEQTLGWYTGVDRLRRLPWSQVDILALGAVRRRPRSVLRTRIAGHDEVLETPEIEDETRGEELVLDLIAHHPPLHLRLLAHECSYACLGTRMRRRARDNFPVLARLLLERTDSMPNRGAARFQLRHPEWFSYPSWAAFDEETRWLVWKTALGGRARAVGVRALGSGRIARRRTPLPGA